MNEAWCETVRQEALTCSLGQPTCGLTTHRDVACHWCGAVV